MYHNSNACYALDKTNTTAHPGAKTKTRKGQNRETPRNEGMEGPNILTTLDIIANNKKLK